MTDDSALSDRVQQTSARVGEVVRAVGTIQTELIEMRRAVGRRTSWEGRFDERICVLSEVLATAQRDNALLADRVLSWRRTALWLAATQAALWAAFLSKHWGQW